MQNGNSFGDFESFTYPDGLRLITVPMKDRRTATVMVLVGTGSRYETKDINGISHFLEHMMFKGTEKRPGALDIAQELDSIGGDSNAFTSKEYTGYYIRAASEHLDLMFDIIADIFQRSKLDEHEIEKEKGVIVEEINMYLDTPRRYVGDLFEMLLYGDQPMGWDIAGEKDIVRSLKRPQFVDYFNTHYFAQNTIIAVSGNIDSQDVFKRMPEYFNHIRQSNPIASLKTVEEQTKPGLKAFQKQTDQTHICLGVRAYHNTHPDAYALDLLATILGGNMSSRLFTELREKRGLAYSVSTSDTAFTDAGYLVTQIGVDNSRAKEAIKVLLEEYKKIANEDIPETELIKAKAFNRGKMLMALDSPDFIASYVAEQELLKKKVLTPQEELELYEKVSVKDIRRVSQDIFQPAKLNLALIGQFDEHDVDINNLLNSW